MTLSILPKKGTTKKMQSEVESGGRVTTDDTREWQQHPYAVTSLGWAGWTTMTGTRSGSGDTPGSVTGTRTVTED